MLGLSKRPPTTTRSELVVVGEARAKLLNLVFEFYGKRFT